MQAGLLDSQAIRNILTLQKPTDLQVRAVRGIFLQYVRERVPTVGRQKISLLLDRRKGGEIRLTEESAQLATPPAPSEAAHIPPPVEYETDRTLEGILAEIVASPSQHGLCPGFANMDGTGCPTCKSHAENIAKNLLAKQGTANPVQKSA